MQIVKMIMLFEWSSNGCLFVDESVDVRHTSTLTIDVTNCGRAVMSQFTCLTPITGTRSEVCSMCFVQQYQVL